MGTKKNTIGLANDAASLIIREIGEKHFRQPPDGAFTTDDFLPHFPRVEKESVRRRLQKMVEAGQLKSGMFGKVKYYWRA